jgi:4-hydroxy-3-methylbut-2-enyl diphosphate reductase
MARGVDGYLIDGPDEIQSSWLVSKFRIGVSAGASAPEILVRRVVDKLKLLSGAKEIQLDGVHEAISFPLPKGLS